MNVRLKHVALSLVGLFLTIATLYIPALANNVSQMKSVSFGQPLFFVSQDFSNHNESFSFFPRYEKVEIFGRPIERLNIFHFIVDFLIIFGVIEVIVFILEKCKEFFVNRKIWPYSNRN